MRKFRLVDDEIIETKAKIGELGVEDESVFLDIMRSFNALPEMELVAVKFQTAGVQIVSLFQLEELPPETAVEFENETEWIH